MSLAFWLPTSVHLVFSRLALPAVPCLALAPLAFRHVYASQSLASLVGEPCGVDLALCEALRGLLRLLSDVFDIALAFWLLLLDNVSGPLASHLRVCSTKPLLPYPLSLACPSPCWRSDRSMPHRAHAVDPVVPALPCVRHSFHLSPAQLCLVRGSGLLAAPASALSHFSAEVLSPAWMCPGMGLWPAGFPSPCT